MDPRYRKPDFAFLNEWRPKKDLPVSAEPRMNLVRDGVSPTAKGKK
jgi:hypothetical protein